MRQRIAREHNIKTAQGRYPITAEEFLQSVKQKVNLSLDEKRESFIKRKEESGEKKGVYNL